MDRTFGPLGDSRTAQSVHLLDHGGYVALAIHSANSVRIKVPDLYRMVLRLLRTTEVMCLSELIQLQLLIRLTDKFGKNQMW